MSVNNVVCIFDIYSVDKIMVNHQKILTTIVVVDSGGMYAMVCYTV